MRGLIFTMFALAVGFALGRGCREGHDNPTPDRVLITVLVNDEGKMTAQPNWSEVLRQGARRVVP